MLVRHLMLRGEIKRVAFRDTAVILPLKHYSDNDSTRARPFDLSIFIIITIIVSCMRCAWTPWAPFLMRNYAQWRQAITGNLWRVPVGFVAISGKREDYVCPKITIRQHK